MHSLVIALEDRPVALAEMGEGLGRAGVSIEGGGENCWLRASLPATCFGICTYVRRRV